MMTPLGMIGLWRRRKREGPFGFEVLLLVVCIGGFLTACGGTSPPPNSCTNICIEPLGSTVYSSLDDKFVFVSPDPGTILDWQADKGNQMKWEPKDKEVVRKNFNKVIKRLLSHPYAQPSFGTLDKLATELKFSDTKPVWLLRGDANSPPAAAGYGVDYSHIYFTNGFFGTLPQYTTQYGILTHELAHIWDGAHNGQLRGDMRNSLTKHPQTKDPVLTSPWGPQLALNDHFTVGEDFAESFNVYFWPDLDRGAEWTDDFGAGMTNRAGGVKDALRIDANGNPTTNPNDTQVKDRVDWFEDRLS